MDEHDRLVRLAAFHFLERETAKRGEVLPWSLLAAGFEFDGAAVPLIGASGIWKPAILRLPISITTAPPKVNRDAPYQDEVRDDGLLVYRYRGTDASHGHNVGLREVFAQRLPLIYFHGVDKGLYRPFWPAVIAEDHPADLHVAVALYEGAVAGADLAVSHRVTAVPERSYARRLTLQRLHQAAFRERVLRAYQSCCAVCRLRHVELLDAAHIVPDSDPRSLPVVENGVSLCKMHHAAFDHQILGIRPDLIIEIRPDILEEVDGPMLRHGLQAVHGQPLILPRRTADRPNVLFIEERYIAFREAS